MKSYFVIGGAGFIGSHFVDRLLADGEEVTIYDDLSSGTREHYRHHTGDSKLKVFHSAVENSYALQNAMEGHDIVIHLASNPDISKAMTDPTIDFYRGTELTLMVLEAMRKTGVKTILYASGSGVYGDRHGEMCTEYDGPRYPLSTYGASKVAGEALIAAYCSMFGTQGTVFRFANVVGARQTHGVAYDFIRRLEKTPELLEVMGDGSQRKPYIHVTDVVNAVLLTETVRVREFEAFNVSVNDTMTVREIARMVAELMGLRPEFKYQSSARGWAGDVPFVKLNSMKLRMLGWRPRYSGSVEAMATAIREQLGGRAYEKIPFA